MPAQTVHATGEVNCTAPDLDAATPPGSFTGRMTSAGTSMGATMCETGDGGYYSGTGMLAMPLIAGQTYSLTYDQLVPIVVGEPVVVDVYGSNEPCALEEKLATWTLDGAWHHPGCFTPPKTSTTS